VRRNGFRDAVDEWGQRQRLLGATPQEQRSRQKVPRRETSKGARDCSSRSVLGAGEHPAQAGGRSPESGKRTAERTVSATPPPQCGWEKLKLN